jgi:AraC-like DNA-binding protein
VALRAESLPMKPVTSELYNAPTLAASTLAGLAQYAESRGRKADAWFAGTTLKPGDCLDPDARLSFREAESIIRAAQKDFPDVALGLAVGSFTTLPSMGALGFSLMSSPTFGAAVAVGEKYHAVTGSLMDANCRIIDGTLTLQATERFPAPDILRFLCEKFFASALAAWRALLNENCKPRLLELSYPEPSCVAEYQRLFDCPIHFSAGRNCMSADQSVLGKKIQTQSPSAHAEALRLCEAKMPVASNELTQLKSWMRKRVGTAPKIEDAAQALGCSERTLRRRLVAAGTSYREMHDKLRAERAQALLRDSRLAIAEISTQLGFSDDREFRRAYKRWTGEVPSQARK